MYKRLTYTVAAIMTASMLVFTGCGAKSRNTNNDTGAGPAPAVNTVTEEKPAVAIAIANTANAKPISTSIPIIQDTIVNCAENYGTVSIINVDGETELVFVEDLDIEDRFKNASPARLKADARSKASYVMSCLNQVNAKNPEVDFLEGLRIAGTALRSLDDSYTSRSIVCCGTGLGTTGYLDFRNNLLNADPEAIVEQLKEREALPDLTGITVYWVGMGQVAAPQEKLLPKQVKNLEAIWKAVVEAAGGEFIPNDYIAAASEDKNNETLPPVSVVDICPDSPVKFDDVIFEETAEAEKENVFEVPVILGEDTVEFVPDEAAYLQPDEARAKLQPIAEYLLSHESVNLLLIGSTAGDITDQHCVELSTARAETVKNTLTEYGIDSGRLTAIGMGSDDPWHIKDAGYDGPIASSNRKVVLLDINTDTAKDILTR